MVGTKCQTEKVSSCTAKRACVSRSMWTTKNGLSETHVGYILMKQVHQGEPTSLLDQVIPWRTQGKCKPKLKIVQENKDLISAGTVKELPGCERSLAGTVAWSHEIRGLHKMTPEKPKHHNLRSPWRHPRPQFNEKTPRERKKKQRNKKERNFGHPTPLPPHPSGPPRFGPPPFVSLSFFLGLGTHTSWPSLLWAPTRLAWFLWMSFQIIIIPTHPTHTTQHTHTTHPHNTHS